MKLKTFSKVAAVSAIALMSVMHANNATSALVDLGTNVNVAFNATLVDQIDVAVTPGTFGTLAAMNSSLVGDTASITLPAAPGPLNLTDDHSTGMGTATQASIVGSDASAPAAALVAVTAGFNDEQMAVTFSNCVNLTAGAGPALILSQITTSIDATVYDCVAPMATGALLTLGATGAANFYVGATITTDGTTNAVYPDGAYAGSVQMQLTY